jgi:hypothetical protein
MRCKDMSQRSSRSSFFWMTWIREPLGTCSQFVIRYNSHSRTLCALAAAAAPIMPLSVPFSVAALWMLLLSCIWMAATTTTSAFTILPTATTTTIRTTSSSSSTTTSLYFFGPKDDGSPGDYVCMVRVGHFIERESQ